MPLSQTLTKPLLTILILTWDLTLSLLNLLLPSHPPTAVIPPNTPGHAGHWPPYLPPTPTSSRSACPMLNALANHSILPHSGRGITFRQLNTAVRTSFNFAPSFCFFVPWYAANFLGKRYWDGVFDLEELSAHNKIEHDASLTRRDSALERDQSRPDAALVERVLGCATGRGEGGERVLTQGDLSRLLGERRGECRGENGAYSESLFHNGFGSANSSTMLTIFGGRVDDLRPMLTDERFAEGWQPRILSRFGLTMAAFNGTVIPVELGVKRAKIE